MRQTDQTISKSSMTRQVKADAESRELVTRETTVKATYKTTVLGTASLMTGVVQQMATGDYAVAVGGNRLASVTDNDETEIAGKMKVTAAAGIETETAAELVEKIAALRRSVAGGAQEIIGSTVYIGTGSVNALSMMVETIDLLRQLAQQCASHTHPETGQPTNASAFSSMASAATATRGKFETFIA